MRFFGVWQQTWLGGGGGGGEHDEWQPFGGPATATPPAAIAAALAAASMCRHETFITSLQTASPAGMQRAGPFLPPSGKTPGFGARFPPRASWPVHCDKSQQRRGDSGQFRVCDRPNGTDERPSEHTGRPRRLEALVR